ncbi:hypothetical protein [Streptomyces sp. SBT349]|uniref:hypothetical protein n=1 Tax=Streptomyces sp. SBT349 TaxID=1580539 RepID=UPI00066DF745|nr:hypothetical protein [Streptomyces sp. SBT349]
MGDDAQFVHGQFKVPGSDRHGPDSSSTIEDRQVLAVVSVDHLTAEAGRAVLAENYAAYVAEYGEPAESLVVGRVLVAQGPQPAGRG